MKFLKNTLLLYFIVSGFLSIAQAPSQFYSDCGFKYLGKDEQSLYVLSMDKICVLSNKDLGTVNEIPLSIKKDYVILGLSRVKMINDKFYILTLNGKTLKGSILDKRGNILEPERSLHTFSKDVTFLWERLKNNHFAVIAIRPTPSSNTPIDIVMFDESLSYLYTISLPISLTNYDDLLSEIRLNDNILSYPESDRNRKFVYVDFSSKTSKPINFNLKHKKNTISDYKVFFNEKENKQMMFAVEERNDVIGLHLFTIEDKGELDSVTFLPAASVPEIRWGTKLDYVLQDKSGIYLTFEGSYSFGNIAVLKIGNNYNKEWAAAIKKNQLAPMGKDNNLASYFTYLDNENVNIIYNEIPGNLRPNIKKQEPTMLLLGDKKKARETVCANSRVSKSNGNVNTNILYKNDTNPIIFVTSGRQISESSFLFSAWDFKINRGVLNLQKIK